MPESVVARIRQEQAAQERAAYLGLHGFALAARHDLIEARAERRAAHILHLLATGKIAEAQILMDHPTWGGNTMSKTRDTSEQMTQPLPVPINAFQTYLNQHRLTWFDVANAAGVPSLTVWSIAHGLLVTRLHAVQVRQGLQRVTGVPYTGPLPTLQ